MYGVGKGVSQDYVRAHMWINLASVNGDENALKARDLLANKMTPQQILDAQKMARDCHAKNFRGCD